MRWQLFFCVLPHLSFYFQRIQKRLTKWAPEENFFVSYFTTTVYITRQYFCEICSSQVRTLIAGVVILMKRRRRWNCVAASTILLITNKFFSNPYLDLLISSEMSVSDKAPFQEYGAIKWLVISIPSPYPPHRGINNNHQCGNHLMMSRGA